ncbi:MAG: DUF4450 domain-containing protein [Candidatus Hydrogenedentes bacterium]|nr:DUF4450 domain-containing protein [Candidatus Hydrogenedentota bacterium]
MRVLAILATTLVLGFVAVSEMPPPDATNCYVPIEGGWRLHIGSAPASASLDPKTTIGVVQDNPRTHRRPLFPPADRTLIWSEDELQSLKRYGFRPLVLAYMEPRFLFDFHSAGGLLGHLRVGLKSETAAKWLHEWADIDVSYVDGRMDYTVRDAAFPGVDVALSAVPLASSAGLALSITVSGGEGCDLVWAYGGASAFSTNWNMPAPEFQYAPEQCAKDEWTLDANTFTLRRAFDKNDVYMQEVFAAARYLPEWKAVILAGSNWGGRRGFAAPAAFLESPSSLLTAAEWSDAPTTRSNVVVVETGPVPADGAPLYVVVGMGGDIAQLIANPQAAMDAALTRTQGIASRIVTHTPDPYLDSAVRMLAFSTEGIWGDTAILHGGWSWRFAYLGWRGWYGPMCYGWTERIRKSIENHTTLGLVREGPDQGALGSLLEYDPGVFYNMNEVFLDQVRQYYEYTNDAELMERIFPVLQGILAWEERRLQPNNECLFENSLNTWISDSHWYPGGQCTQASAYMLGANNFLATLAERLGKDATPYRQQAEHIRGAMQKKLWMPERGVFAEYLDTRGAGLLHTEPELPTIYHSSEFGAADARQIVWMLQWADANLKSESTPGGGKLVWSSNWYPNHARSYTHSTYELSYGEQFNLALTNYLAGRADEAYAILRGTLCGVYNGPTPGGLACHSFVDGRQRANDEFADAISMWGRAVAEGLFGIAPNRPEGYVALCPQFPEGWNEASIESPALNYTWRKDGNTVSIEWSSPVDTRVRLRLPLDADKADEVLVDGTSTEAAVEPGFAGVNWLFVESTAGTSGAFQVRYTPGFMEVPAPLPGRVQSRPQRAPWTPPGEAGKDLAQWTLIDLASICNARVTDVLQRVTEAAQAPAMPASQVGWDYWKQHLLQYHGSRNQEISDAAWRNKTGPDGIAWTADGIPFKTSKEGPNIAAVTRGGGFPLEISIPIAAQGKSLYLMISGMTFPVQSHVTNLRITLRYADGSEAVHDLVNPFDIGDCWSTWCGRYHDSAVNGFENIGGRSGPAGSIEVQDLTQPVALDTEAQLIRLDLKEGVTVESLRMEAVANDVIFGIMGASVRR